MLPAKPDRIAVSVAVFITLLTGLLLFSGGARTPKRPPGAEAPCTTLTPRAGWVMGLAFSRDGTALAIGTSQGDVQGGYQVWDLPLGRPRATRFGPDSPVTALSFSPDGRLLATGTWDGTVRVEGLTGEVTHKMQPSSDPHRVFQLAFSPDGQALAGGSNWGVTLWDVPTGRERAALSGRAPLAFSPDGQTLATVRADGPGVRLWDVGTGRARPSPPEEGSTFQGLDIRDAPEVLALAPDWATLGTGEFGRAAHLWDVAGRKRRVTLGGHEGLVTSMAFSPDGRLVATASQDRTVKVWEAATGRRRATLAGHTGAIYALAFSPDGQRLASGGFDQTVRVWDLARARR